MIESGFNAGNQNPTKIQTTLKTGFERSGIGLHSGGTTRVRVLPTSASTGRYFVRVDLADSPIIPARVDAVSQTTLSTELAKGEARVRTVEHLLAALTGMGVDNARIEIDGLEVPLLDGSAVEWVKAITQAGVVEVGEQWESGRVGEWESGRVGENLATNSPLPTTHYPIQNPIVLREPIWIYQGDAFVAALPGPAIRFTYGIDFDLPAIGNQWHSWSPAQESFATEIAPARTFGLAHQIDQLLTAGLIKGGSLDNALVCNEQGWLNPPLRFSNEPVRHKLLDLVGDLSLLGTLPTAHFLAYKASHHLHLKLSRQLAQIVTAEE